MAAEEFGYAEGEQPTWSAGYAPPPQTSSVTPSPVPVGGAAFGIYPPARSARPAPVRSPLDAGTTVLRREPAPAPPPAEMRAYDPTLRERAVDRASATLERLGFDRAGARRAAQSALGGPQSNLPLGIGLADIPLVPSIPFLMQEGYRGTERAMSAAQRGDYGAAAMEYLGAAGMMLPVSAAVPPVAREVGKVLGSSMAARPVTAPMGRGQRGVFLGEKLFTPQEKARVSTAERLEREGVSPDDVLVQTGLVRDLDGTWAVEVSDDKMKVKALDAIKKVRQSVVNRIADLEDAREIRGRVDQGMSVEDAIADYQSRVKRDITPFSRSLADDSSDVLEIKLDNAYTSLQAPIRGLKMKDVVEHPELFGRLPKLAEMQIDFVPQRDLGPSWVAGEHDPSANAIRLRSQYILGDPAVRGVLGHEIQHAIDFGSGKDYGISPETIKGAREHWATLVKNESMNFNADATALQARRLMDANPSMTPEQALDEVVSKGNHYGTAEDFGGPGTINPNTQDPFTEEGMLRSATLNIIRNVPSDALNQRVDDSQRRLREAYEKRNAAAPDEAGRQEQYMRNQGEARARLTQTRIDLTPEERLGVFPMREQSLGLDRPPESLRTLEELTGGLYGLPQDVRFGASTARSRQRGAIDLGGPRPIPLSEALGDSPTTLRVLENLPGKRTTVTEQELREQMRRPEVTKAEKDVLERVISRMEGGSVSAENLVKEVGLETAPYRLEPQDDWEFATYGLDRIKRQRGGEIKSNVEDAHTTIYRSPTETSKDNHFNDPKYFGHTRSFKENGVIHVIEIQSDLVQKAGRELSPEERLRLEQGNAALSEQMRILQPISEPLHSGSTNYEEMANEFEKAIPALEAANEDFKFVFGSRLTDRYPTLFARNSPETAIDRAIELLRNSGDPGGQQRARRALNMSLMNFMNALDVRRAENTAKLAERGTAEAQRPMFKNWERRLIREELSRAVREVNAALKPNPEYGALLELEKDFENIMLNTEQSLRSIGFGEEYIASYMTKYRKTAENRLRKLPETPEFLPTGQSVIRFADADTVKKVENWTEYDLSQLPVEEAIRRQIADAGDPKDIEKATRYWENKRKNYDGPVMRRWQNQTIYDRYKDEVTSYLKSLGGRQVKDKYGVGWWEVPVKPQQRRTQIFGMGGAAAAGAAAAGYNAPSLVGED